MASGESKRRPESLLDLAFQAIQELTEKPAEQWALLEILKRHPLSLLGLSNIMRHDHGYSYDYMSKVMSELVKKGLAMRPKQGKYEPAYAPIMSKMIEILDREEWYI